MKKKSTIGLKIFAILLMLDGLCNLSGALDSAEYKMLLQPLPSAVINVFYALFVIAILCAFIAAVGLFFSLKDIFRKFAIFYCFYQLFAYLIQLPLFSSENFGAYITEQALEILKTNAGFTAEFALNSLWGGFLTICVIEFLFINCLLLYLTRPKVKERFK